MAEQGTCSVPSVVYLLMLSVSPHSASVFTALDSGLLCIRGGSVSHTRAHLFKRSWTYAAALARYVPSLSFAGTEQFTLLVDRPCRTRAVSTTNGVSSWARWTATACMGRIYNWLGSLRATMGSGKCCTAFVSLPCLITFCTHRSASDSQAASLDM
jgi:hypothetical protein